MSVQFPNVRVGDSISHESLSVFPLFADPSEPIEYLLSDEVISSETITVEEVGEEGSVPELTVENKGDTRVLFLEGEALIGAKQNRIMNASILVPAKTKMKIPVSCVEQGRWHYQSRKFGSSPHSSPSMLRSKLKGSVSRSIKRKQGHRSDQSEIWEEVSRTQTSMGVSSDTMSMSDTYSAYEDRIDEYRKMISYVEGCRGMAVAVGSRIIAIDLFDKEKTCQKVWNRLVSGLMLDAVQSKAEKKVLKPSEVETFINQVKEVEWEKVDTVGEGQEYRSEFNGSHCSALICEGASIHLSVASGC